jgi:hypothetical protein
MRPLPLFGTEANLPRRLGSLTYEGLEVPADARLGIVVRYAAPQAGTKADCSLYDLGLADLPSDLRAAQVVDLFRRACGDVLSAAQRGWYLDMQLRASEYLHLNEDDPEPSFLFASFSYRQAGGPDTRFPEPRLSHLALRIDGGLINQVRYTYLQGPDDAQSYQDCLRFLRDWLRAVQARTG